MVAPRVAGVEWVWIGPVNRLLHSLRSPLGWSWEVVCPRSDRQQEWGCDWACNGDCFLCWCAVLCDGLLGPGPLRQEARELQRPAVRYDAPVEWSGGNIWRCGREGSSRHMRSWPGRQFVEAVAAGQGWGSLSQRRVVVGSRVVEVAEGSPGLHSGTMCHRGSSLAEMGLHQTPSCTPLLPGLWTRVAPLRRSVRRRMDQLSEIGLPGKCIYAVRPRLGRYAAARYLPIST
jgi:hypothetical protein